MCIVLLNNPKKIRGKRKVIKIIQQYCYSNNDHVNFSSWLCGQEYKSNIYERHHERRLNYGVHAFNITKENIFNCYEECVFSSHLVLAVGYIWDYYCGHDSIFETTSQSMNAVVGDIFELRGVINIRKDFNYEFKKVYPDLVTRIKKIN